MAHINVQMVVVVNDLRYSVESSVETPLNHMDVASVQVRKLSNSLRNMLRDTSKSDRDDTEYGFDDTRRT